MIPSVFMCLDKFLNDQLYNIDKKYNEAQYNVDVTTFKEFHT